MSKGWFGFNSPGALYIWNALLFWITGRPDWYAPHIFMFKKSLALTSFKILVNFQMNVQYARNRSALPLFSAFFPADTCSISHVLIHGFATRMLAVLSVATRSII
ncbi:hypothetical protein BO82DRAFT_355323 [Aspergillus uvarum CBS 121591]|uniref:Uncharacterized protein n=1 Tax=Aspergillus uvarum CBS 121591 TaxID=1448315 RepID=A0A319C9F5_9EURO|nr:hypothetical protein BO82DRAFT_355323 [Aspergillus uvarum CBS 121591]PYH80609.1 hypothetical protein BO82DRAFT_355323 [Aspergillus uvarum CBS 121591]